MHRPPAGCRGRAGSRHHRPVAAPRASAADPQPRRPRRRHRPGRDPDDTASAAEGCRAVELVRFRRTQRHAGLPTCNVSGARAMTLLDTDLTVTTTATGPSVVVTDDPR